MANVKTVGVISLFFILFLLFLPEKVFAQVVINEVLPDPAGADTENEWLELYNPSSSPQSIDGYVIEDKNGKRITLSGNVDKWQVIYPKGAGGFALTNTESTIKLYESTASTQPLNEFTYTGSSEGMSWGRIPDGGTIYSEKLDPSPGSANQPPVTPTPTPTSTPTTAPTATPTPTNISEAISTPTPTPTSTPVSSLISSSFSSPQTVGEEFTIGVTLANFEVNKEYYLKSRVGPSESELNKGETENSGSWYSDTDAWLNFPKITTNASGGYSGSIKAKLKSEQNSGNYKLRVRARKVDSETNYDSSAYDITFNSASSSSSTPSPTATPVPASALTPTPTIKLSLTPTKTPTPSLSLTPTPIGGVLGEEVASESGLGQLSGEENGMTASSEESGNIKKFIFPALAAILGLGFIGFSVFSFLKRRRQKEEPEEVVV